MSEQRLKAILDTAVDGILVVDLETEKFAQGNRAIMNMLGYGPDELMTLCPDDIRPMEALAESRRLFRKVAKGGAASGKDVPIKRRDGSVFFADITVGIMHLAGRPFLVCNFRDISERRVAEQKVMQLARTDQLTDLPNRRVFIEALQQAIGRAGPRRQWLRRPLSRSRPFQGRQRHPGTHGRR